MRNSRDGKQLLQLLRDDHYLRSLYDDLLPQLERHVSANSGEVSEAKDLFQESMIILFKKCHDPNFELTVKVETFLYSIAKRRWLYELRKKKKQPAIGKENDATEGNTIDQWIINAERTSIYQYHFSKLSDGCKALMELFFQGLKMEEITQKLSLSSIGYTRKKKHGCQEKLLKSIKSDPKYKELRF